MTGRQYDTECVPKRKPASGVGRREKRHTNRRLALAGLLASVLALMPVLGGAAAPDAKHQLRAIVPAKASVEKRESPYVRFNRQHREAARAVPSAADPHAVQPPPKLAGQVQRH